MTATAVEVAIMGALVGRTRITAAFNVFRESLDRGQIIPTKDLTETIEFDLVKGDSIYKVKVTRSGPITYCVTLNEGKTTVEVRQFKDGSNGDVIVTYRGQKKTCSLEETADKFKVTIDHKLAVFEKDNDPTILKSPYTGKLLGYKKNNGEFVGKGDVYASIESMKLVFDVEVKKEAGHLEQVLREGDPLYPGTVIARVWSSNSESCRPRQFMETFPEWAEAVPEETNLSELKKFNNCFDACTYILNGYIPADSEFHPDVLIDELFGYLYNPSLGHAMLKNILSGPALKREPSFAPFARRIEEITRNEEVSNFRLIMDIVDEFFTTVRVDASEAAKLIYDPLYKTCEKFLQGCDSHVTSVVNMLLKQYGDCEKLFEGRVYDDAVAMLNDQFSSKRDLVVETIYSHTQLKGKNKLMLALLKRVGKEGMHLVASLSNNLREIGDLIHTDEVSDQCRRMLCRKRFTRLRFPFADTEDFQVVYCSTMSDPFVECQLEAYNPGFTSLPPSKQRAVVEKFISEGKFRENMVHEDSDEWDILSMPADVRKRLFQRYLARKNSM